MARDRLDRQPRMGGPHFADHPLLGEPVIVDDALRGRLEPQLSGHLELDLCRRRPNSLKRLFTVLDEAWISLSAEQGLQLQWHLERARSGQEPILRANTRVVVFLHSIWSVFWGGELLLEVGLRSIPEDSGIGRYVFAKPERVVVVGPTMRARFARVDPEAGARSLIYAAGVA